MNTLYTAVQSQQSALIQAKGAPPGYTCSELERLGTMTGFYTNSRDYFGGMSPWVPAVFGLALVGALVFGTALGNVFLFVMALGWTAFLAYAVFTVSSPTRSMRTSEVLPFGVGLITATLMGVVGLTLGGFGDRWSTGSLVLAALAGAGAIVTTRQLLSSGEQSKVAGSNSPECTGEESGSPTTAVEVLPPGRWR